MDNHLTLSELAETLARHHVGQHGRNLVLVALPAATAHRDARWLAGRIGAEYVDFDCGFLQELEKDGWRQHVRFEQRGRFSYGQRVAKRWMEGLAGRLSPDHPLLIGNANLAARYELDLAAPLYDASANGLCVIAAAGHIQGPTLYVHGRQPQTAAGSPTYEVVAPPTGAPAENPRPVQDQLL